jgi:hypothetical protein
MDYLIVFGVGYDDKVQKALRESRLYGSMTEEGLVQKLEEVTGASNMLMMISDQDKMITKKGRRDFLLSDVGKNSVICTLINDQIDFYNFIYGANVDPKYL